MGGARKSPAQKDVTKITVSGLIRPETGTYIYIECMSHCDIIKHSGGNVFPVFLKKNSIITSCNHKLLTFCDFYSVLSI